jgi:hypothetical protein
MSLTNTSTNITIHTNKTNILVTEAIIHAKGKYIIIISGLDKDFVNNICLQMSQILNYTYLFFLDNPISDDSKNYNNILDRVEELLKIKPQGIIISLLTYPDKYTMINVKLHINLSINQTYFNNIKNKYNYSDNFFIEYNNILKSNKINKYINIKLDSDFKQIKRQCFDTIITSIEKHYYGTNYDKVLENRNYNKSNNNNNTNNTNNSNNTNNTNNTYNKFNNNKNTNNTYNKFNNNKNTDNKLKDSDISSSVNSDNNLDNISTEDFDFKTKKKLDNSESESESESKEDSDSDSDSEENSDSESDRNSKEDSDSEEDSDSDRNSKEDSDSNSNSKEDSNSGSDRNSKEDSDSKSEEDSDNKNEEDSDSEDSDSRVDSEDIDNDVLNGYSSNSEKFKYL